MRTEHPSPAGRHLVGQLDLRSNVELHLEKGAVLEGAVGLRHYRVTKLPYSEGDWGAVVAAFGVTNVAVTGAGEIFGNGTRRMRSCASSARASRRRAAGLRPSATTQNRWTRMDNDAQRWTMMHNSPDAT